MKKKIIINILLVIALLAAADISAYYLYTLDASRFYALNPKYYFKTYKKMFYSYKQYDNIYIKGTEYFNPPCNTNINKPPVLIMGCSFAYDSYYKACEILKRPVYDRAVSAKGINEALYQLRRDEFYRTILKVSPEYFLYIYIPDQIRRTCMTCSVADLSVFWDKKLNLKHDINNSLLFIIKEFLYVKSNKYYENCYDNVKRGLAGIKAEADKHWGKDVKYIFLYYWYDDNFDEDFKKYAESLGFVFYKLSDLTDINLLRPEYTYDGWHPNNEAWEIVYRALAEKTGM